MYMIRVMPESHGQQSFSIPSFRMLMLFTYTYCPFVRKFYSTHLNHPASKINFSKYIKFIKVLYYPRSISKIVELYIIKYNTYRGVSEMVLFTGLCMLYSPADICSLTE